MRARRQRAVGVPVGPVSPTVAPTQGRGRKSPGAALHPSSVPAENVGRALTDRSTGAPLDAETRRGVEAELSADLGHVRVHADGAAASLARGLGAAAFTRGEDVYFGAGRYRPATSAGRRLLRHELVHVVQQRRGDVAAFAGGIVPPSHPSEISASAGHAGSDRVSGRPAAPVLQRGVDDEWPSAGATVDDARRAAEALEEEARKKIAQTGFIPSWAVDMASQSGWRGASVASMSSAELDLLHEVVSAKDVIVGRSSNVTQRGMFVLDEWLQARGIQWTQRWQDVYNKSLFLRTSSGAPVKVMAGAGYSAAEAAAAEEGARIGGITNEPYWPDPVTPSAGGTQAAATGAADVEERAAARSAAAAGGEGVALRAGVAATVLEVVFNPALQFGWEFVKGFSGDYQEAWNRVRSPSRHRGFAQGWVAHLVGLDRAWLKEHLAPQFVDRTNVAREVIGAAGMAEKAYVAGLAEGFRYGEVYSRAAALQVLNRAYAEIARRGEQVFFDDDGAMQRDSLILVAAVLQHEADDAIRRWDELREKRAREKAAREDYERRSQRMTVGHYL